MHCVRQRGPAANANWPLALLQALRAGRWRLTDPLLKLTGASYSRIRNALNRLSADRRQLLHAAWRQGIGFEVRPSVIDPSIAAQWRVAVAERALPRHGQALLLESAGHDRFGRRHWLQPAAQRAWQRLREHARRDGVDLELVSSFRSERDQLRILMRKLGAGQSWPQILAVNAPPGYSEHHTGCAVDVAVPHEPVLTEAFELTSAFAWLQVHAARFGFELSYPRDNIHGFVYEPWHWCFRRGADRDSATRPDAGARLPHRTASPVRHRRRA